MESEKQANPPPYSPETYPPQPQQQYPAPPQPQPYPAAPPYPQYPAPAVDTQPPPSATGMQSTTVVVTAPTVVMSPQYGYQPVRINCPHCHADVVTTVDYEIGGMAWMICGIIVLVGVLFLWCALLGCCFIPFCINDCKDAVHVCPNCGQMLAHVKRLK